jgi:hypothetical protein
VLRTNLVSQRHGFTRFVDRPAHEEWKASRGKASNQSGTSNHSPDLPLSAVAPATEMSSQTRRRPRVGVKGQHAFDDSFIHRPDLLLHRFTINRTSFTFSSPPANPPHRFHDYSPGSHFAIFIDTQFYETGEITRLQPHIRVRRSGETLAFHGSASTPI